MGANVEFEELSGTIQINLVPDGEVQANLIKQCVESGIHDILVKIVFKNNGELIFEPNCELQKE